MHAALLGFGLGFLVALQLGPMSLFLIRSTLRGGWGVGLAIGGGIALVDGVYAACGAAGVGQLLAIEPVRLVLGLVGAVVLIGIGVRTLRSAMRVRLGWEVDAEVATPSRAFMTSVAGTASNPLTIASWAAVFATADVGGGVTTSSAAILMVGGVAVGSLTWGSLLATGVTAVGRALGSRAIRLADAIAGLGLLAFGGVLALRVAHDE
ncbi:MAG TPA: LysE family transporter [Solirubrobacteraceae bacterium]|nr:LysE family transporter [Solirubrobacteraceae bacterium]